MEFCTVLSSRGARVLVCCWPREISSLGPACFDDSTAMRSSPSPALSVRSLDSGDDEPRRRRSSSTLRLDERRPSLRRRHTGQELDRDRDRPSSRKPSTVRANEEIIKELDLETLTLDSDEVCASCGVRFGFLKWRYQCQHCGAYVCWDHSRVLNVVGRAQDGADDGNSGGGSGTSAAASTGRMRLCDECVHTRRWVRQHSRRTHKDGDASKQRRRGRGRRRKRQQPQPSAADEQTQAVQMGGEEAVAASQAQTQAQAHAQAVARDRRQGDSGASGTDCTSEFETDTDDDATEDEDEDEAYFKSLDDQ